MMKISNSHAENIELIKASLIIAMLFVVILMVTCIAGCSFQQRDETKVIDEKTFHPSRPLPITLTTIKWDVINQKTYQDYVVNDASSYMCLKWEDYLTMGQNMQVILKNYKDQQALLCYYRKDLHEKECEAYQQPKAEEGK